MDMITRNTSWTRRPSDMQLGDVQELATFKTGQREASRAVVIPSRHLRAEPILDDPQRKALAIVGPGDVATTPTHWSFGQVANLVGAPPSYLRNLPADIAADCLNYGIYRRNVEDVGALVRQDGGLELAAVTGPNYGRV